MIGQIQVIGVHTEIGISIHLIEFWSFFAFIPFLRDVQSVDQDGLCMGNRGFGF